MLTIEQALEQVDPTLSEDAQLASATQLVAGALANEVYWSSRGMLEYLKAKSEGHGIVIRGDPTTAPTGLGTPTAPAAGGITEPPAPAIDSGGNVVTDAEIVPPAEPGAAAAAPTPPAAAPDNPMAAVAELRAQLVAAGITPTV